jgi:hypothetical protein
LVKTAPKTSAADAKRTAKDVLAPATKSAPAPAPTPKDGDVGSSISDAAGGIGDWFGKNRSWIIPALSGVGAMASSPSRYLSAAMLQGLGAGAQAWSKEQKDQADLGREQSETKGVDARTAVSRADEQRQLIENSGGVLKEMTGADGHPITGAWAFDPVAKDLKLVPYMELLNGGPSAKGRRLATAGEVAAFSGSSIKDTPAAGANNPKIYAPGGVQAGTGAPGQVITGAPAGRPGDVPISGAPVPAPPAKPYDPSVVARPHYDNTLDDDDKKQLAQENAFAATGARKAVGEAIYKDAIEGGNNADTVLKPLKTMGSATATGLGLTGAEGPGIGENWKAPFVKTMHEIAHSLGISDPNFGAGATSREILEKSQVWLGSMAAREGGQKANAALQAFMAALPNMGLTKPAMAELTAGVFSQNQRERDRAAHAGVWRDSKGPEGYGGTFTHFDDSYRRHYSQERQGAEQHQIAALLLKAPKVMEAIMSGRLSQDEAQKLISQTTDANGKVVPTGYSPSLVRYFY